MWPCDFVPFSDPWYLDLPPGWGRKAKETSQLLLLGGTLPMILAESWRVSLQKTLVPRFGILEFPDVWAGAFFWFKNPMFIHVSGIVCFFQTDFFSEWYELQHVTVCLMDPNGMLDHREMTRIFLVKQSPSYGFWVMFLTPQLRPAPFFRCFWGLVFSAVQSRPGL